jgi:formylglycine-generating enzyme required for sulfatase activity
MPNRAVLILASGFCLAALLAWWRPAPVRSRRPPLPAAEVPPLPVVIAPAEEDPAGLLDPLPAGQPHTFVQEVNGASFAMVEVEGGSFLMGDRVGLGSDNERPTHYVTLDSYRLGQTEVTQALWRAVMGHNPSQFAGCDQCPVESVSWHDCQQFIDRLNKLTRRRYRLPTEAEWEYAARGGRHSDLAAEKTGTYANLVGLRYAGSNVANRVGWHGGESQGRPQPVALKRPNQLHLYDLSGNVWEWCADWHADDYYAASPRQNPVGPAQGVARVHRGGCWSNAPRNLRVANRNRSRPTVRSSSLGFRLAM